MGAAVEGAGVVGDTVVGDTVVGAPVVGAPVVGDAVGALVGDLVGGLEGVVVDGEEVGSPVRDTTTASTTIPETCKEPYAAMAGSSPNAALTLDARLEATSLLLKPEDARISTDESTEVLPAKGEEGRAQSGGNHGASNVMRTLKKQHSFPSPTIPPNKNNISRFVPSSFLQTRYGGGPARYRAYVAPITLESAPRAQTSYVCAFPGSVDG